MAKQANDKANHHEALVRAALAPEYLLKLEQMLGALGYRIEIVRKP
jgi:hypothetical protein